MEINFTNVLERKYGQEITKRLFKDNRLQTQNISLKNADDQKLVRDHVKLLSDELGLGLDVNADVKWAFDFPGWTRTLDLTKKPVKKYMIVGLEPHIERFDFQITYGLSEQTPVENSSRFSIDHTKKEFIQCKNDSSIIWTNLFNLFAGDDIFKAVTDRSDLAALNGFLDQFYITDLCHFAPQDKANAINNIPNWPQIRAAVADEFLEKEVRAIKPELIIAQGEKVFSHTVTALNIKDVHSEEVPVGSQNWKIWIGLGSEFKVLSLPHIGSQMINRTFWGKNLGQVKSILKATQVIS